MDISEITGDRRYVCCADHPTAPAMVCVRKSPWKNGREWEVVITCHYNEFEEHQLTITTVDSFAVVSRM